MNRPPEPHEPRQIVMETDDRPVVRDDEHNPVVRQLDLVKFVQPLKETQDRMKLEGRYGMALLGVITVASRDPSAALKVVTSVLEQSPVAVALHLVSQFL